MDLTNIFVGEKIRLTEMNPQEDAEKESLWTHSIDYARLRKENPVRPMAAFEIRKDIEEKLKEAEQEGCSFYFAVHSRANEEALLGFLHISGIEWANGQGLLRVLMGTEEIAHDHLAESLFLGLRYAFDELNLYHIYCEVPAYEIDTIKVLEKAGFVREACLREIVYRAGSYHDRIFYGMLAEEWRQRKGLA